MFAIVPQERRLGFMDEKIKWIDQGSYSVIASRPLCSRFARIELHSIKGTFLSLLNCGARDPNRRFIQVLLQIKVGLLEQICLLILRVAERKNEDLIKNFGLDEDSNIFFF